LKLAAPLEPSEVEFEAWYMNEEDSQDQRLPRRQEPNVPCSPETLKEIGVLVSNFVLNVLTFLSSKHPSCITVLPDWKFFTQTYGVFILFAGSIVLLAFVPYA
jgi:hypothetical protein